MNIEKNISMAIILEAAGNSKRFGSNKLLHLMEDGRPMICGILDTVRDVTSATNADVKFSKFIVTQYEDVAYLAPDFNVVMNEHPEYGISHSMQLGIEAAGDADAYMFCVCDQPHLSAETLRRLIDDYKKACSGCRDPAVIASLAWEGRMCNPKIFSSHFRDELMSLSGDTGGRQIIKAHEDSLVIVEASSLKETTDIDSPAEL